MNTQISILRGQALCFGDHIDTDRIIPGKYTKTTDLEHLASHVMEDLDPQFHHHFQPGGFIVAGVNFGCGSSREQAPLALKQAGVAAVIASSFARLFFRNAVNIGLPALAIGHHSIQQFSWLQVNPSTGEVFDEEQDILYRAAALPAVLTQIIQVGGLVEYLRINGRFPPLS